MERHVQVLDQLQFHYGRMWALEIALWDLIGKITEQPLWKLLGGRSNTVWCMPRPGNGSPRRPGRTAARTRAGVSGDQTPFFLKRYSGRYCHGVGGAGCDWPGDEKLWWMPRRGGKCQGIHDPAWDFRTARRVADQLAELDVFWLAEPLPRQDYRGLADLRKVSKVQIAGGEGNWAFTELREIFATWVVGCVPARCGLEYGDFVCVTNCGRSAGGRSHLFATYLGMGWRYWQVCT